MDGQRDPYGFKRIFIALFETYTHSTTPREDLNKKVVAEMFRMQRESPFLFLNIIPHCYWLFVYLFHSQFPLTPPPAF